MLEFDKMNSAAVNYRWGQFGILNVLLGTYGC